MFAKHELATALGDALDKQGPMGIPEGFFRASSKHLTEIGTVVGWLRNETPIRKIRRPYTVSGGAGRGKWQATE